MDNLYKMVLKLVGARYYDVKSYPNKITIAGKNEILEIKFKKLKEKNRMSTNIKRLEKFVESEQITTVTDVMQELQLTKSQILTLMRKTYRIQKKSRGSEIITATPWLPDSYDDLLNIDNIQDDLSLVIDDLQGTIIYKKYLFWLCYNQVHLLSQDEFNMALNEIGFNEFQGSRNSFQSIRRDISYMLSGNDLL